ncbi:MAG: DUF1829 domain-containing protein [Anaerolineaceae bacterium]|nr:DUF1829 domain-containing protein [Anaerolineaceae bacterium]
MIVEIQRLTDQYHNWLRDKTTLREVDDWIEITTPYLDRHNDFMQIYAKRSDGGFMLTDDGYTIDDLELSGCKLETPKRRNLLKMTLNGFGVRMESRALQVHASRHNFSLQKHNLLQAMLAINDLFYLSSSVITSLFYEDVVAWLDISRIRYITNLKFAGKSGYDHRYDFVIPKSDTYPERVLLSINNPDRANAQRTVFAWEDTREARTGESRAYAILNDSNKSVSENVMNAFLSYGVHPVPWSEREKVREELVA